MGVAIATRGEEAYLAAVAAAATAASQRKRVADLPAVDAVAGTWSYSRAFSVGASSLHMTTMWLTISWHWSLLSTAVPLYTALLHSPASNGIQWRDVRSPAATAVMIRRRVRVQSEFIISIEVPIRGGSKRCRWRRSRTSGRIINSVWIVEDEFRVFRCVVS